MFCFFAAVVPVLFVSPSGNDSAAGNSVHHAFASLERMDAELVSLRKRGYTGPVSVRLSGLLRLAKSFECGPEVSNVSFVGPARISGGLPVEPWNPVEHDGLHLWQAPKPTGEFRQLFAPGDSGRLTRSVLPEAGYFRFAGYASKAAEAEPWNVGQQEMLVQPGDWSQISNPRDVEVVASHLWVTSRLPIKSLDRTSGRLEFTRSSVFKLSDDHQGQAAIYRIENSTAGLGRPGTWCTTKDSILFQPFAGQKVRDFHPEVSRLPVLWKLHDAQGFQIRDVEFVNSEYTLPAESSGDVQAAVGVPGALQIENCQSARVDRCRLVHLGGYGIEVLGANSDGVAIERCELRDLGGGGIKVGHGTHSTKVKNCQIEDGGKLFASAIGIWIGDSGQNLVSHNAIRRFNYTGISVGWTWGYAKAQTQSNRIEWNDIADIGQGVLSDLGGIYTLGNAEGSIIAHNRIQRVNSRGYGGWGIYLDEGTTGMTVQGNLVSRCKTGSFHQHYGKENRIEGNVFTFAAQDGQIVRTRREDHVSLRFLHNVVVWDGTPLLAGDWSGNGYQFEHNVLWSPNLRTQVPPDFAARNWAMDPKLNKDGIPQAKLPFALDLPNPRRVGPQREIKLEK